MRNSYVSCIRCEHCDYCGLEPRKGDNEGCEEHFEARYTDNQRVLALCGGVATVCFLFSAVAYLFS